MNTNYSYNVDDKILNYKGRIPQNLFVRRTVNGKDTTYTVHPVRAKSKLGIWLQEHSRFFNFIITWFLSKSLQKDVDCRLLRDRVNPEPQHNHVLGKIIYRITKDTTRFFQDNDKENVLRNIYSGIIDNPKATDDKKIEWIMDSITANGKMRNKRAEILFQVMTEKDYFNQELFDQVFARFDDFNTKTKEHAIIYAFSKIDELNDRTEVIKNGLELPNLPNDIKIQCITIYLYNADQFDSEDTLNIAQYVIMNQDDEELRDLLEIAKEVLSNEISSPAMKNVSFIEVLNLAEAVFLYPDRFSNKAKENIAKLINQKMPKNGKVNFSDHLAEELLVFVQNNDNNLNQLQNYLIDNTILTNNNVTQATKITSLLGETYNFEFFGAHLQQVTKFILENQNDFNDIVLTKLTEHILKKNKNHAAQEFKFDQLDQYPFLDVDHKIALAEMTIKNNRNNIGAIKVLLELFDACSAAQRSLAVEAFLNASRANSASGLNVFENKLGMIIEGILFFPKGVRELIYKYISQNASRLKKNDVLNAADSALKDKDMPQDVKETAINMALAIYPAEKMHTFFEKMIPLLDNGNIDPQSMAPIINFIFEKKVDLPKKTYAKMIILIMNSFRNAKFKLYAAKDIANFIVNNRMEFSVEQKADYLGWIIEKHYSNRYNFEEATIQEAVRQAIAFINAGPYTQNQIDNCVVPLAEMIEANCDEEVSQAVNNVLLDIRFWNKPGNFKVNAQKKQYDLSLPLDLIKLCPENILELFHRDCFSQDRGINRLNIITLNDSFKAEKGKNQADDKGGPSRQFIAGLFENLVKKDGKLTFEKTKKGFYLPKSSNKSVGQDEEKLFEAIGKLMGMCLTSKGYLLIGQIFDTSFYKIMAQIYPYAINGRFEDISSDALLEIYVTTKESDDAFTQNYRALSRYPVSDDQIKEAYNLVDSMCPDWPDTLEGDSSVSLRNHLKVIREEIKKIMIEEVKTNQNLLPIFKICQGMVKHYRGLVNQNQYDSPADMNAEKMIETIQGKFSKELVMQSLKFPKDEYNRTAEDYQGIEGFFKRWIDESDGEQVKKFLIITTGSNTIGFETGIDINVNVYKYYEDNKVWPTSNTCSKQITIQNYPNYQLFKRKLDETIRNAELTGMGFDKE